MGKPQVLGHWFTEAKLLEIIFADGKQAGVSKLSNRFCLELHSGMKLLTYVCGSRGRDGELAFDLGRQGAYLSYLQKALEVAKPYAKQWNVASAEEAITSATTALWLNRSSVFVEQGAVRFPHDIK